MRTCGCNEATGHLCAFHQTRRDVQLMVQIARGIDALGTDGLDRLLAASAPLSPGLEGPELVAAVLLEPRRRALVALLRAALRFAPACRRLIRVTSETSADMKIVDRVLFDHLARSVAAPGRDRSTPQRKES